MDIKHCKFCRKMHQGLGSLCPQCVQELDRKYLTVRNHLDEKPNLTLHDLADETSVDEKSILFLVREGRLMLKNVSTDIKCMKCGVPIASGRYCEACKSGIMQTLSGSRDELKAPARASQSGSARQPLGGMRDGDGKVELHIRSTKK